MQKLWTKLVISSLFAGVVMFLSALATADVPGTRILACVLSFCCCFYFMHRTEQFYKDAPERTVKLFKEVMEKHPVLTDDEHKMIKNYRELKETIKRQPIRNDMSGPYPERNDINDQLKNLDTLEDQLRKLRNMI